MKKDLLIYITAVIVFLGVVISPIIALAQDENISGNVNNNCIYISRSIYFGQSGQDVTSLQEFLKNQGYFNGNVTGYFGYGTWRAVVKFQKSQNIKGTGFVGIKTRNKIHTMCGPLPVESFVPSNNCKTWFDGCNSCSRSTIGGPAACTQRACFVAGKGYCTSYFDNTNNNLPPVISGISGPTTLLVNQSGTFSVTANDPQNQQLTYNILWGDELLYNNLSANSISPNSFSQTSTFTHSYTNPGTYTVAITVSNRSGQSVRATTNVSVNVGNVYCTQEYTPVCGQPPEPACRYTNPQCLLPTPGPRTYSNICELNSAGATYLYGGQCNNGY